MIGRAGGIVDDRYVGDPGNVKTGPETEMFHLNDMPWWEVIVPPRWHRCVVQTIGVVNYFDRVERCGCGAIRNPRISGHWTERNSRKRKDERPAPAGSYSERKRAEMKEWDDLMTLRFDR